MKKIIAILGLLLSLSTLAEQHEPSLLAKQASELYLKGDYKKSFETFREAAQQGDAIAQFNLGAMYLFGEGTIASGSQAEYWIQKSGEQGYINAQTFLGVMYYEGIGVQKNLGAAKYVLGVACGNKDPRACKYYKRIR